MGMILTKLMATLFSKKDVRILMVGLDNAGKTTILYKLKLGEVISTIPTLGFNVETVEYKSLSLTVWDVGGQGRIRLLWKYYYQSTQGLIFVIDGSDRERVEEAKEELHALLQADELRKAALLLVVNKQDVSGAMSPAEVAERLGLIGVARRKWHVQGACATSGVGLYEGLEWLSCNIDLDN